jgi:hypothetical protein
MYSDYDTGGGDLRTPSQVLREVMGIGDDDNNSSSDKEVRQEWGCHFLNHTAHPEWNRNSDPACHNYNSSAVVAAVDGIDLAIVFLGTGIGLHTQALK